MFEPLEAAGLGPSDTARLLGVSRVTVSLWLHGHHKPHHLLADPLKRFLDAVRACVDTGTLPVPRDVIRRERGLYIRQSLRAFGWTKPIK